MERQTQELNEQPIRDTRPGLGEPVSEGRRYRTTLPGIGPEIRMGASQEQSEAVLTVEEEALFGYLKRQEARYEWFLTRCDDQRTAYAIGKELLEAPQGPGAHERALVALSRSEDPMAALILRHYEPPAYDPALSIFHQICQIRARRR